MPVHIEKDQVGGLEDEIGGGGIVVGTWVEGGRYRDQRIPVGWTIDERRAVV
jgi:hypothetical protein